MARTTANIKKAHYRVMHRAPAAYTQPTSAAEFTTFLGTFTELGYCRDKETKVTFETAEQEVLDDGKNLFQGWNATLEGILLQTEASDYSAYEAIENVLQDIFLYDEVTGRCIFFPNALMVFAEAVVSGEIETVPFRYEATDLPTKAAFRDRFLEPTT